MKLLLSADLFYPSTLGGPANTLYWLAKSLVLNGIDTTVITTNAHIEPGRVVVDRWEDVAGIKVRYCKTGTFCYLKVLWYSWKELKDCKIVMLCDMFQRQIFPVALMALLRKKKIIWSARGELMEPALAGNRVKRLYIALVRTFWGRYATFHATSIEEKIAIHNQLGEKTNVVVIPNYIDLPNRLERNEAINHYFLYVGRVTPIKALDCLIIGFAKSNKFKNSDFKLIIAGPDQNNYKLELENIINAYLMKEKVIFVGNVSGQEKFQLYANAYFSCLLSHSENFGNVVIEALSQGTPVIASTGTPWEILNDTNSGYWIDNNPQTIGECIDNAIGLSKEEYLKKREAAVLLSDSYDVKKNIKNWVELFDN